MEEHPLNGSHQELFFDLHKVEDPRLWMPPPDAMETIMEMFNEDRMAHPKQAHLFVVPRLMVQLWRKHLGKDADVLMTITAKDHFWKNLSTNH